MGLDEKLKKLEEILTGYGQMIVALSGGVDSTFLLAFAAEAYRKAGCPDNVAAITATGPQFAADEAEYAAARLGLELESVREENYEDNTRIIAFYRKKKKTEKRYPRRFGEIKKEYEKRRND